MTERHLDLLQKHRELQKAFDDTLEMNRKLGSENWKFEKENEQLKIDNYNHNANLQRVSDMVDEAKKIIKDLLWSEIHYCTGEEFCNIRSRAEIFINNEGEEC